MYQYYAWRHLQQTHQKIKWYPGNTESLDTLLANQVEMWNSYAPSLFLMCIGVAASQMKAKAVTQTGVLTYREVSITDPDTSVVTLERQLVYQSGVETRILKRGDDIRKPEALNLLPPSLRRGEDEN